MNNEENLLVHICQCFLTGKRLSPHADIEWEKFYSLTRHHNLIGVCHCVLAKSEDLNIPDKVKELYCDKFYDLVYRYEQQENMLSELRELFLSSQTPFIPFKGAVLRKSYPVPEARSMGDIDVLIRKDDRDKVKSIMTSAGFKLYSANEAVDEYTRAGLIAEVHTELFDSYKKIEFADGFENASFDGFEGRLDDSFHFAYMIAHTANHLKYTGAGIRFVLDLAVMLDTRQIDLERVFELLRGAGLEKFAKMLLTVCCEWFGCAQKYCDDTQRLKKYLVSNGVFGSLKAESDAAVSRLIQLGAFDGDNKNKSRLSLLLRLAFPSYEALRKANYINFLDGKPWLLPAAWIYRFFYNIKKDRHRMLGTVKNIDDKNTRPLVEEELEFLEEIGLYGI